MATATTTATEQRLTAGDVGLEAWENLLRATTRLLGELDRELREEHGFTAGDYDVLVHLDAAPGGGRRMCDLAEAVLLSPSGLSRRVDRLERAGLVERRRASDDARSIEAALTGTGKRTLAGLRRTHRAGIKSRFADQFSEEELATLRTLLGRLDPDGPADDARC